MNWFKTAVVVLALGMCAWPADQTVFLGEVSDSQCAMNVHSLTRSHQEMIKKGTLGTDSASCARACIRRGGEWVLRDGDNVYRLKNQDGIDHYAGEQVKITGTLDPNNGVLDNAAIEIIPAKAHADAGAKDSSDSAHSDPKP